MDEFETGVRGGVPQPRGAYYKNFERKMCLKKKCVNVRRFLPCFQGPIKLLY